MNQTKGGQSLLFKEPPVIVSAASVVGSKEAEGPLEEELRRNEADYRRQSGGR